MFDTNFHAQAHPVATQCVLVFELVEWLWLFFQCLLWLLLVFKYIQSTQLFLSPNQWYSFGFLWHYPLLLLISGRFTFIIRNVPKIWQAQQQLRQCASSIHTNAKTVNEQKVSAMHIRCIGFTVWHSLSSTIDDVVNNGRGRAKAAQSQRWAERKMHGEDDAYYCHITIMLMLNHFLQICSTWSDMPVYACVCVCVREIKRENREGPRERQERECPMNVSHLLSSMCALFNRINGVSQFLPLPIYIECVRKYAK